MGRSFLYSGNFLSKATPFERIILHLLHSFVYANIIHQPMYNSIFLGPESLPVLQSYSLTVFLNTI